MKQVQFLFILFCLIIVSYVHAQDVAYKKRELLVKFKPGTDEKTIFSENKFSEMKVRIIKQFPNLGIWLLGFDDPVRSDREVLTCFKEDTRIKAVQFNHRVKLRSTTPNDQYFSNQWSLFNTGQTGGVGYP